MLEYDFFHLLKSLAVSLIIFPSKTYLLLSSLSRLGKVRLGALRSLCEVALPTHNALSLFHRDLADSLFFLLLLCRYSNSFVKRFCVMKLPVEEQNSCI